MESNNLKKSLIFTNKNKNILIKNKVFYFKSWIDSNI